MMKLAQSRQLDDFLVQVSCHIQSKITKDIFFWNEHFVQEEGQHPTWFEIIWKSYQI